VGPRVRQVLEQLDEELQGWEQTTVCLEVRIVLRAVQDASLVLFDQHLAERDRWSGDVLSKSLTSARAAGRDLHRHVQAEAAVGPALHHAVDQAAEIADQAMIVAEEYSEYLGKSEDDLAVREAQQEPLVHILAEEQDSLLRA
jgi:hypothetical protein